MRRNLSPRPRRGPRSTLSQFSPPNFLTTLFILLRDSPRNMVSDVAVLKVCSASSSTRSTAARSASRLHWFTLPPRFRLAAFATASPEGSVERNARLRPPAAALEELEESPTPLPLLLASPGTFPPAAPTVRCVAYRAAKQASSSSDVFGRGAWVQRLLKPIVPDSSH